MATPAEDREQEEATSLTELTAQIVAAYVSNNTVAIADIGPLIDVVGQQLRTLGQKAAEPPPAKPEPAVPVRRSVQQDRLICLVCGKPQKVLRRHLGVAHQLTPEAYRELFGLKPDYPMAAPSYSQQRSETAKRSGLGRTAPRPRRRKGQEGP